MENMNTFTTEQLLPLGSVLWYPFPENSRILIMGDQDNILSTALLEQGHGSFVCQSIDNVDKVDFDYIVIQNRVEEIDDLTGFLLKLKEHLASKGHILFAADNRFGLQYFCGERDPYTNRIFDSIEGYKNYLKEDRAAFSGHLYSKSELEDMLNAAGFGKHKYYSILPGLMMPQQMYAQGNLPQEELAIRYTPLHKNPHTVFLNQGTLFDGLIKNGMFHEMANAYFFDATIDGQFDDITSITTSLDRGTKAATATILHENNFVEKKALFSDGIAGMQKLVENTRRLAQHGIKVVSLEEQADGASVTMPLISSPTALTYLRKVFYDDQTEGKTNFLTQMDRFIDLIEKSSKPVTEVSLVEGYNPELGTYYDHVYIDLVPLNCFMIDGEYVFFDQEFALENWPINVVILRTIDIVYMGDRSMEQILPREILMERYGVGEKQNILRNMGAKFINELRNCGELEKYRKKYWLDGAELSRNRMRMNYSEDEIARLYEFPMKDVQGKNIYIFGTGAWAKKFMGKFGEYCQLAGALDNNEAKWGQEFQGTTILAPTILKDINPESFKVIICIKHCAMIVNQLENLGVKYYSAFDPDVVWPETEQFYRDMEDELKEERQQKSDERYMESIAEDKSNLANYHVDRGYVAGVFDLFHLGHVNVLRRAKEHCDYLIVGVVSDEQASKNKAHSPYVSEQDRLEVVRACKYVDDAFILPYGASGTRDVYEKYHFDTQFSGSDYEHDPYWLKEQAWLREHGSDMVFFPYTESVSSTKLKEVIEKTELTCKTKF